MLFTADHDEPRRILQKFIAAEINPFVDEWEDAGIFPAHELFKKLGNLGFLGLNKPTEFGGQGLDYSFALMSWGPLHAAACRWRSGCRRTWPLPRWRGSAPTKCAASFWRRRYQAMRWPASASPSRARAPTSPRSRPMRVPMATT